jgi:hypothetical protein
VPRFRSIWKRESGTDYATRRRHDGIATIVSCSLFSITIRPALD